MRGDARAKQRLKVKNRATLTRRSMRYKLGTLAADRLAQAGHGLWVEAPPAPGEPLAEGAEGVGVFALQAGFTRLGYDLPPSGKFDAATKAVVTAFQRHWRQSKVDGVADGATRAQLIALMRLAA